MQHCLSNTTSKSEANVDSKVILDETETKIRNWVKDWEIQSPQDDLSDRNRAIIESLSTIYESPKNKSEEGAGQQPATKKCKVSDDSETSNASTTNCWELFSFVASHCKTNKDISKLQVTCSESKGKLEVIEYDDENFEKELAAAKDSKKTMKSFFFNWKKTYYHFHPAEDCVDEKLKCYTRLFADGKAIQDALSSLFEKSDEDYCKNLVSDGEARKAKFSEDTRKAAAIVVTGESGSGKTSFAKQYLQRKFKDASFIYKEIGEKEEKKYNEERCKKENDKELKYSQAQLKAAMTAMREQDFDEYGIAYRTVAEISRKQNKIRNDHASRFLDDLILAEMVRNDVAREWWEHQSLRIKQLVIIIDEIGKLPDLARGLVDEVRIISEQYKKKYAEEVLIVLVGSGLDGLIEEDSIPFKLMDVGDESADSNDFLESLKGFGTDPSKSEVITLKCPELVPGERISSISVDTIQKGSYSKVLATNSRMLFNGVIPMMQSKFHTLKVDEIDLESRLEQIGSTNIIMDYAARVYTTLNGLKNCTPTELRSLLLQQFIFLRRAELSKISHNKTDPINPAITKAINEANKLNTSNTKVYTKCLSMGIITSDIISTSKALRYLACEGSTAPLYAADGHGFEIVLQHHLYCLSRAMYHLSLQPSSDNEASRGGNEVYFCGRYSLKEAWPPRSTTKLGSERPIEHLNLRMEGEKEQKKNNCDDVSRIKNLVENYENCDLVMRQTVSNAQGADIIVLSKRGNVISLDLYQAKHLGKIPGPNNKEVAHAFSSLGVLYDCVEDCVEGKKCFNTKPKQGSAGYSNACTQILAKKLKKEFRAESVEVRNRVVVYSKKGGLDSGWNNFPFDEAEKKNLWVWTGDFLEPTISALCISGAE